MTLPAVALLPAVAVQAGTGNRFVRVLHLNSSRRHLAVTLVGRQRQQYPEQVLNHQLSHRRWPVSPAEIVPSFRFTVLSLYKKAKPGLDWPSDYPLPAVGGPACIAPRWIQQFAKYPRQSGRSPL
jgi:hypothetical protein